MLQSLDANRTLFHFRQILLSPQTRNKPDRRASRADGRIVINATRKEYVDAGTATLDDSAHLCMGKESDCAANVSRRDVREVLDLAAQTGIKPEGASPALEDANRVLREMHWREVPGAKYR